MSQDLFKNLGVNIARILNENLGPSVLPATLLVRTVGTPSATQLTGRPTTSEQSVPCRGFLDSFDSERFGSTEISQGSRVAALLGDSLPSSVVPKNEDRVIIEGETLVLTGKIVRDPASALYVCEVRA